MDSRAYTGDFNYIEFIANSKSGQFFFYSHDGCYMIKTQTKEECVLLRDIMPKYVAHLTSNPNSLLVRFYGMHRYGALVLQFLCIFRCHCTAYIGGNLAPETSADFLLYIPLNLNSVAILAVHCRVKFKTSKIYFVIMSSVFNTDKPIDIKYAAAICLYRNV
jgi:hypothetical protein